MRKVTVDSFAQFIEEAEVFDLLAELVLFRGQPVSGNLIPSIARRNRRQDTTEVERKVLEQLRLMGASLLPSPEISDLDLLVIAQHAGLKTRLLDWTSNPLAALWFACADEREGNTFVYALQADLFLIKDVYKKDPFSIPETRVVQPRLNNPRIIAQHGWFTLHRYASGSRMFVPLENNKKTKDFLTEIKIAAKNRDAIRRALERHGINERSLFPDLAGLCKHLNWKYARAIV